MPFTREQRQNAAVIIRVGNQVGASARDILIALMTSMQESGLRNLDYGDRDSVGLFQQRHTMGWGTRQQILNPEYSARAFFLGAGTNSGLLDLKGRNSMALTEAAQAVQRSAFPDAYAKHEDGARSLLEQLGDGGPLPDSIGRVAGIEVDQPTVAEALMDTIGEHPSAELDDPSSPVAEATNPMVGEFTNPVLGERNSAALDPNPSVAFGGVSTPSSIPGLDIRLPVDTNVDTSVGGWRAEVVDMARNFLGTPYVWGGTTPAGFDCSGLLQYVYSKAGIDLPRISADQARAGKRINLRDLKVGDLVAWDNSSRNNGADHIAMYIGNGKIIHAPRPGSSVEISNIFDRGNAWGVRIGG